MSISYVKGSSRFSPQYFAQKRPAIIGPFDGEGLFLMGMPGYGVSKLTLAVGHPVPFPCLFKRRDHLIVNRHFVIK